VRYSEEEIKSKLKKEFDSLENQKNRVKKNAEAVVILAAEEEDIVGQNKERIDKGLKIISTFECKPLLIYLGTQNHNKSASIYIRSKDITYKQIKSRNQANTKDQIIDLRRYSKNHEIASITIVSHIYHIPRIKRYCKILIPKVNITFWKIGKIKDYKRQVNEEIEKILEYSKKGDLPLFL